MTIDRTDRPSKYQAAMAGTSNLILIITREPRAGCLLPQWRAAAPGRSCVAYDIGDSYGRFVRMWAAVSEAIAHWNRAGRPVPAWTTADDRAFLGISS